MSRREGEAGDLEEQLAEAQAQIEALQSAAADAEARAATLHDRVSQMEAGLAEAESVSASAQAELAGVRAELEDARAELRTAAAKYREARLAAAPEVPGDLVPEATSLDEVDRGFESALRVVSRLRERLQEESRGPRVPAGSPARRAPDLSALSPAEKIRVGLQRASEREGR
jgi:chromosome segregation ATPase